jgi:hypothetical protein
MPPEEESFGSISALTALTDLNLSGATVCDGVVGRHLSALPHLQRLDLSSTAVTTDGLSQLFQTAAQPMVWPLPQSR